MSLMAAEVSGEWPINEIRELRSVSNSLSQKRKIFSGGKLIRSKKAKYLLKLKKNERKSIEKKRDLFNFQLSAFTVHVETKPCGEKRVQETHVIMANNTSSENSYLSKT